MVPDTGHASPARAGEELGPDPARVAAGWTYRFVAVGERIDEMVSLYRELGFEVSADPIRSERLDDGCSTCFSASIEARALYTRRSASAGESPNRNDRS